MKGNIPHSLYRHEGKTPSPPFHVSGESLILIGSAFCCWPHLAPLSLKCTESATPGHLLSNKARHLTLNLLGCHRLPGNMLSSSVLQQLKKLRWTIPRCIPASHECHTAAGALLGMAWTRWWGSGRTAPLQLSFPQRLPSLHPWPSRLLLSAKSRFP